MKILIAVKIATATQLIIVQVDMAATYPRGASSATPLVEAEQLLLGTSVAKRSSANPNVGRNSIRKTMKTIQKADPRFFLFFLGTLAVFSGCQSGSNTTDDVNTPTAQNSPAPTAVIADGWTSINIQANYAKTTVDSFAHWVTNRNACGKDADGALELELWNRLVTAVNHAVTHPSLADARCQANDAQSKMDGTAEVTLTQGKRILIEARDSSEICTYLNDETQSKQLIDAINEIILIADKEDCPFGWGGSH